MRVNLIRKASIDLFIRDNARSRSSMNQFFQVIKVVDWSDSNDMKATFGSRIDIICNGTRAVFDCGGGAYRIICGFSFGDKFVFLFIKFIGTHAEYDKLCKAKKKEVGVCDVDLYKA